MLRRTKCLGGLSRSAFPSQTQNRTRNRNYNNVFEPKLKNPIELDSSYDAVMKDVTREYRDRKSPAARFGSKRIGSVVLPDELHQAIQKVIVGMFIKISISIISY
jgi:hypothetical protein